MTDIRTSAPAPAASAAARVTAHTPGHRLRALLRLDAATCAATGVLAAAAADPVADLLGVDSPGWVRAVGVFLVLYGVALLLLARARGAVAGSGAAATIVGDGLWVAATIALALVGAFSGVGTAVMVAVGVVVGALGTAKAAAIRR